MAEIVAIVVGSIVLITLINYRRRPAKLKQRYYRRKWQEVRVLRRSSAAGQRLSVIEADKLLDRALEEVGVNGNSMSDRLKAAGRLLGGEIEDVWQAHRLRNSIVHKEVHPKTAEIRRALKAFEQALKRLGAL